MSISSYFYLLAVFVLAENVAGVDPLFHFCSSPNTFRANDPYDNNLHKLTSYLASQAPPTGFSKVSIGQNPHTTYGLALCRGDVSSLDCKTCVVEATGKIRQQCPNNKGAIIWYDNCLLKYSEDNFFGQIDVKNGFRSWNPRVVKDPASFNGITKTLLTQLDNKAHASPRLFATGELELHDTSNQTIYGLVQCTRDINSLNCKKCLDGIIGELQSCCNGKEGGRVVGGSCNFRYEIYPFVKP